MTEQIIFEQCSLCHRLCVGIDHAYYDNLDNIGLMLPEIGYRGSMCPCRFYNQARRARV